jgi:hypothetical protein
MQRLGKIIFDALCANSELVQAVGGRIKSTCFEVPPMEQDNTPLPYIIITDDGMSPSQTTKDNVWMPYLFRVNVGVEIGAASSNEVWDLELKVMKAIADHIKSLAEQGVDIPYLNEGYPQTEGIAWDWNKPCYFDTIHYQCDLENTNDDEQEDGSNSET